MGSWFASLPDDLAEAIDRRFNWSRLPLPAGLLTLIGLRDRLRERNLYDSGRGPLDMPDIEAHENYLTARTLDGTHNDLDDPLMGSLGSRFGRNVPLEHVYPEPPDRLLDPNPRTISRELLTRDEFVPATTLNLLAGAGSSSRCTTGSATARTRSRTRSSSSSRATIRGPSTPCASTARGPTRAPTPTGRPRS